MTKINLDSSKLQNKMIPDLYETVESLSKMIKEDSLALKPNDFKEEKYFSAISKINSLQLGISNIIKDVERAIANYNIANESAIKNNTNFDSEYRIGKVEPIIKNQ